MDGGGVRELPLSKGKVALVDAADYEWLSQWKWCLGARGEYASRTASKAEQALGPPQTVALHRAIMKPPRGMVVDHIDGDGLNNTRANLRVCSQSQNLGNQRPASGQRFKGVNPTRGGKSSAQIKVDYALRYLGTWPTADAAAMAYDEAAIAHFGEFARLNFPGA